jgi:taurine transport system substrate-binding protein
MFAILLFLIQPSLMVFGSEEKPEKIVIGYMTVPNPLTIIKELSWIEKTVGIPVEWVKFESGRHVLNAINQNEVDLAHIGSTPCAAGIAKVLPIEVVWVSAVIADGEALVVRKDAEIDTLADLVGKKVAVPFESTAHYALKVYLNLYGLTEKKLNIVDMEPSQMPLAWDKGDIQAAYVWNPSLARMKKNNGKIILTSKELALRGFPTADLLIAEKNFSKKYPQTVLAIVTELNRAAELCRKNPKRAASIVAGGLNISAEQAEMDMEGMVFLTAAEQKVGLYIGKLQWEFGLYTLLKDAADFLESEGSIEFSPPWPAFRRSLNPWYVDEIYRHLKRPEY